MSSFDRIKPPKERLGQRDASRSPESPRADTTGRAGLFSVAEGDVEPPAVDHDVGRTRPAPRPDVALPGQTASAAGAATAPEDPRQRSLLTVECGHCGDVCPMGVTDVVRHALPLTVVAPWRSHPVFALCPCGQRRAWLKPRVGLPGR